MKGGDGQRVGSRHGVFGKGIGLMRMDPNVTLVESRLSTKFAEDGANAVVAYGLTKALLPFELDYPSIYLLHSLEELSNPYE